MNEIWKNIEGYEGKYQVSNLGRVKALEFPVFRLNGSIGLHKERIFKGSMHKMGYLFVGLRKDHYKEHIFVHRLVAHAFPEICGEWFEGAEVDHIDGNRLNNAAENLRWVTHRDNMNNPITVHRITVNHK